MVLLYPQWSECKEAHLQYVHTCNYRQNKRLLTNRFFTLMWCVFTHPVFNLQVLKINQIEWKFLFTSLWTAGHWWTDEQTGSRHRGVTAMLFHSSYSAENMPELKTPHNLWCKTATEIKPNLTSCFLHAGPKAVLCNALFVTITMGMGPFTNPNIHWCFSLVRD